MKIFGVAGGYHSLGHQHNSVSVSWQQLSLSNSGKHGGESTYQPHESKFQYESQAQDLKNSLNEQLRHQPHT